MGQGDGDLPLPPLRDDLSLSEGPTAIDGTPTWNIFDPVRNRYFRIGWTPFQLISRWASGSMQPLVERVNAETTCRATDDDVADVVKFLYANGLTRDPPKGDSRAYLEQHAAARMHWTKWLAHHYLFFKIPLVRPTRFLQRTYPLVEPLFSRTARTVVLVLGIVGLYLVGRQWDLFVSTFLHFFSLEGLLLYGLALIFVKICHELGHAYTATRYGCPVPTMGVAFLVMFPVLYTDATNAWRLRSQHQRLAIGAAGMATEIGIAMVATAAWSFLPDGALRSAAFFIATTSWITSLTVNVNPFMRFDGYYILSDLWNVHGLQPRAFALAKWRLRELLFKPRLSPPESLPRGLTRRLVLYAWGTWIYRLFLFIAIALLVYYMFFKLLGLLLFLVEILLLISAPILKEMGVWWSMRQQLFTTPRFALTSFLLVGAVAAALVPWGGRISLPAVLKTPVYTAVYAPEPGRIRDVLVEPGHSVERGDVLLVLDSPELDSEARQGELRMQLADLRLARSAADQRERDNMNVLLRGWKTESARLKGIGAQRERLVIRAPISGRITRLEDGLHEGRWINPRLRIANIISDQDAGISALSGETDVRFVAVGMQARFYPDDPRLPVVEATVTEVNRTDSDEIESPYLASIFGGEIASQRDADGKVVANDSVFRVRLTPEPGDGSAVTMAQRGIVHVDGAPRSLAIAAYESVAAVLIRESGF